MLLYLFPMNKNINMPTKKTTKPVTRKPAKKAAKPTVKKTLSPKVKAFQIASNPLWNIWDTGKAYKIRLSVPGLTKENIHVQTDGNNVTISCKKENTTEKKGKNYLVQEYHYDAWSKSTHLPEKINSDTIKVGYKEGVLKLTLEKKAN